MKSLACAKCGIESESEDAQFCFNCGAELHNYCSNNDCLSNNDDEPFILPSHHKFCDSCGSKTTFMVNEYFDE